MEINEYVAGLVSKAKAAQEIFEGYNQEQVDAIVKAFGKLFYDNAERFAAAAWEETQMGNLNAKTVKHQRVTIGHWAYLKDKKSVGLIDYDAVAQVATYAKPLGVLACITPVTNPTVTIVGNGMCAFKCRNAIIVASHPKSVRCTQLVVSESRALLKSMGAPEDILQYIESPSIEATNTLLPMCDAVVATGGPGMVKSAYSCGRPSFGVGQGNVQSFIDRDCKDQYDTYAEATIRNRIVDNGVPCTSEQTIHIPVEDTAEILDIFTKHGAFIIDDEEKLDILRVNLFDKNPDGSDRINAIFVGKSAMELSKIFDLNAPEGTLVLLAKARGTAQIEPLCREKLSPIMAYLPYEKFEDGVDNAVQNLRKEGAGHSCCLLSKDQAHIEYMANRFPVSRIIVNGSTANAGGNSFNIGLNPTMSLGCGSWGRNSISENLTYYHLMNTTKVATFMPNAHVPTPEEVWA